MLKSVVGIWQFVRATWPRRCALSIGAVALAVLLRAALGPLAGRDTPYITIWPVVAVVAFSLGMGPSLAGLLAGVLLTEIYPVAGPFDINQDDRLRMASAFILTLFLSWTGDRLRKAKQDWERTFDSVPDLIAILDSQHRILRANRGMAQRLGVTPQQCVGLRCYQVVHGLDAPPDFCPHRRTLADGQEHVAEVHEERLKGDFLVSCTPLLNEQGKAIASVHVARDITDRKRSEAALVQAKTKAEAASQAKDQFLAMLSHELRTPLTPTLLTVSLLAQRQDLPEEVRSDLATIRRHVQLEARIIDDLLDLTRIAQGKFAFDMRSTDLHPLICSAADICSHGEGAKITLELRAQRHWVRGDSGRLQQVFWNLLNNARKFTPPSGSITVRSSDLPDGRVRVDVADTGRGSRRSCSHASSWPSRKVRSIRPVSAVGWAWAWPSPRRSSTPMAAACEPTVPARAAERRSGSSWRRRWSCFPSKRRRLQSGGRRTDRCRSCWWRTTSRRGESCVG